MGLIHCRANVTTSLEERKANKSVCHFLCDVRHFWDLNVWSLTSGRVTVHSWRQLEGAAGSLLLEGEHTHGEEPSKCLPRSPDDSRSLNGGA